METRYDDGVDEEEYKWMFCKVCGPSEIIGGTCSSCGSDPLIYLEEDEVLEASNGHEEEYREKLNEVAHKDKQTEQ